MILYRYFKWKKFLYPWNEKSLIFFAFSSFSDYNMYVYVLYFNMRGLYKLTIVLLWIISLIIIVPSNVYAQNSKKINYEVSHSNSIFIQDPVGALNTFYTKANNNWNDRVQRTDLDTVTSRACTEAINKWSRFTITNTLCYLKSSIWDYLQYVMYIGLAAATILLIWNGFKLVTSTEREKQMTNFRKNLIYIIIWVILLISFYYIIDIFISAINLIAE